MQESFDIAASSGRYKVVIGQGLLKHVIESNPCAIFLIDDYLSNLVSIPLAQTIFVNASEANKALERMADIIIKLRELGANRSTHLIAIGGGVVQDIASFSASIYMRGIRWSYMPSSLLSMADSCIGGKSSINVLGYKNLIGNFYPPSEIYVDVVFTKTLTTEMIIGGLFEAGKICYARGHSYFQSYLANAPATKMPLESIENIIICSLKTKKWFIETDEFDQKERLLLNFGHTFGHAIEASTDFGVSHGVAVGIGMLVAINFSIGKGWLTAIGIANTRVLSAHIRELLAPQGAAVVSSPPVINLVQTIEKFRSDKKHLSNIFRMVCPKSDGELELVSEVRSDDLIHEITLAYKNALDEIHWEFVQQDDLALGTRTASVAIAIAEHI